MGRRRLPQELPAELREILLAAELKLEVELAAALVDLVERQGELGLDAWLEDVGNILEFLEWYGDDSGEVWITEMGCLNGGKHLVPDQPPEPTPSLTPYPAICQANGFMYEYVTRMTGWLNSNAGRWIDRYAWYTDYSLRSGAQTQLYSFTPGPTYTPTRPSPTPGGPT